MRYRIAISLLSPEPPLRRSSSRPVLLSLPSVWWLGSPINRRALRVPGWSSRAQLAVDLGTANTVVYRRGEGIVLFEPSVVAIDERTGEIHAVGTEARRMIGRTPAHISATRPLRDGVIADFEVTEQMLRHFIRKAAGKARSRADVMVCVPSGITQVKRNAVTRAALAAGAAHAFLIEEPMAAAIGAGLPVAVAGEHVADARASCASVWSDVDPRSRCSSRDFSACSVCTTARCCPSSPCASTYSLSGR
jgi:MreB/Mbl protein